MAGAAVLCAEAALRSGCGYVSVATVGSISADLTTALPSALLRCTLDAHQPRLRWEDVPMLVDAARTADAIVIGPGLGDDVELWLAEFVARLGDVPLLVDADALNGIARRREMLRHLTANTVLTPHAGEAARLLGWGNDRERVEQARQFAVDQLCTSTPAVVILKGADTIVAQHGVPSHINPTGNAGLAKAGSGDVLSGIIGALLSRGMPALEAAIAGTWIHGRAADVLAGEVGEESYISSDIARALGRAFADYAANVRVANQLG